MRFQRWRFALLWGSEAFTSKLDKQCWTYSTAYEGVFELAHFCLVNSIKNLSLTDFWPAGVQAEGRPSLKQSKKWSWSGERRGRSSSRKMQNVSPVDFSRDFVQWKRCSRSCSYVKYTGSNFFHVWNQHFEIKWALQHHIIRHPSVQIKCIDPDKIRPNIEFS